MPPLRNARRLLLPQGLSSAKQASCPRGFSCADRAAGNTLEKVGDQTLVAHLHRDLERLGMQAYRVKKLLLVFSHQRRRGQVPEQDPAISNLARDRQALSGDRL